MSQLKNPVKITDVVLRDAHQSLFATRLRLEDMLPIAEKLDQIGYWSLETWGGATFDSCIRFIGEDPWHRLRELKAAMPNTRQQMLLRGQNLLGYRHYADDVVDAFVERAATNGIDVFRVFDAMNDPRNMSQALAAVKKQGAHAQATLSYTKSPAHDLNGWVTLAEELVSMGADSICIKDMSGILTPYDAYELITKIKANQNIPLALHAHATAGLSSMTLLKAIEAGVDHIDTAISSMSMTYGHSPTESLVAALQGTDRDTGLNIVALEEVAAYFREIRKKYAAFEGSLRGIDSRILVAQVPGGMLTNMESQLKQQGAEDKFDAVLNEIPRVRKDLGYIPLVTPTSQIVGTQAVLNILAGERYKNISKETQDILRGKYGAAPAPYDIALQKKVLNGDVAITCRPADLLKPEMATLTAELETIAKRDGIRLADQVVDDVLTYALFPQIGLKFLQNRDKPEAFEVSPQTAAVAPKQSTQSVESDGHFNVTLQGKKYHAVVKQGGTVQVMVNGHQYDLDVSEGGSVDDAPPIAAATDTVKAPLAGNIFKVCVKTGDAVVEGQVIIILEAMKMETEVSAPRAGVVGEILTKEGDAVSIGDPLLML